MPLIVLQYFTRNLDNRDPEAIAHGAIAFIDALGLTNVDLLGFSIGSFVAQEVAHEHEPDARVKIYPDSAHGFLFQRHAR